MKHLLVTIIFTFFTATAFAKTAKYSGTVSSTGTAQYSENCVISLKQTKSLWKVRLTFSHAGYDTDFTSTFYSTKSFAGNININNQQAASLSGKWKPFKKVYMDFSATMKTYDNQKFPVNGYLIVFKNGTLKFAYATSTGQITAVCKRL